MEVRQSLAEKEKGLAHTCSACGSKNLTQYFGNMIVISSTHLH
jgi:RNA polymerase subunit RPABC4/transcription elongation factor Spt4